MTHDSQVMMRWVYKYLYPLFFPIITFYCHLLLRSVLNVNAKGTSVGVTGLTHQTASIAIKATTTSHICTSEFVPTRRNILVESSNVTRRKNVSKTTTTTAGGAYTRASTRGEMWTNMNKVTRSTRSIMSNKDASRNLRNIAFLIHGVSRGGAGSGQGLGQGLGRNNHGRSYTFDYDDRKNNQGDFYNNGNSGDDSGDNDSFTEVFYEEDDIPLSASAKIGNSLLRLFLGPAVILLSCWFLWKNEEWAIKTHRSLEEALDAVRSIDSTSNSTFMMNEYNEKLIHFIHEVSTDEKGVQDYEFGLKRNNSISLSRIVEIYQWVEHKSESSRQQKRNTKATIERKVTYKYHKQWLKQPVSSALFRYQKGHENCGDLQFEAKNIYADNVFLGSFQLSQIFIDQMTEISSVPIREVAQIPIGGEKVGSSIYFPFHNDSDDDIDGGNGSKTIEPIVVHIDGKDKIMYRVKSTGELFSSKEQAQQNIVTNPSPPSRTKTERVKQRQPQIGDVRVIFVEVKCKTISVIGKLKGNEIVPWSNKQGKGYDLALLEYGIQSDHNMIQEAQMGNDVSTWFKRGGGLLANYVGFHMFTSIVSTVAGTALNWVPLFGPMVTSIVQLGLTALNIVLASSLSLAIMSVAWLFYRPLIGMPLLLLSFGFFFIASQMGVSVGKHE